MTKNEFLQLIEKPTLVSEQEIVGLQQILKKFPYCQSAQMLLTKAFHVSENLNFESQLKRAAAFVGSRKQIHSLLFNNELVEVEVNSAIEEKNVSEDVLLEGENASHGLPKDDLLEQQILVSAINSSILGEVSDTIPEDLSLKDNTIQRNDETSEIALNTETFDEGQVHSFSDWLNFYGDDVKVDLPSEHKDTSVIIEPYNTDISIPEKAEFYSASKMAKLSVQEDDDLVTETLANIYADQGNFERAIKAFEKLQLKYPEKRVYFAGRIKEIQNNINL